MIPLSFLSSKRNNNHLQAHNSLQNIPRAACSHTQVLRRNCIDDMIRMQDVPDEVKEDILERSQDQILADNLACQCICSILLSLERSSPSPSPFIEQGRVGNALSKEVALRSYIKQNHGSLMYCLGTILSFFLSLHRLQPFCLCSLQFFHFQHPVSPFPSPHTRAHSHLSLCRNFVLGQEGRLWFDVTAGVNGCYLIANKALVGGTSAPNTST